MNKEINLKEILLLKIPKDCYWEDMGNLTNCPEEYVLEVMKEACHQTLELAAENATLDVSDVKPKDSNYDNCWYSEYTEDYISVSKQSIINTINQIK